MLGCWFGQVWPAALRRYKVDLALAGDYHDYYADADGPTLKVRCGSIGHGVALFLDVLVHPDGMQVTARTVRGAALLYPLYGSCWWKPFGQPARKVACPPLKGPLRTQGNGRKK